MVIQCPECQTRFKLADEKIKPEGIKVRCSRCRHIFAVLPPAAEPEPVADTPATELPRREEEVDFGAFNMESVPDSGASPAATGDSSATAAAASLPDLSRREEEPEDESSFSFPEPTADAARDMNSEPTDSTDSMPFGEEEPGEESIGPSAFAFEETEYSAPEGEESKDEFAFGELPSGEAEAEDEFSFHPPHPEDFAINEETTSAATDEFSLGGDDFAFEESESAWSVPAPGDGPADDFDFTAAEPTGDSEEFDFSNISFGEDSPEPPPAADVSLADPEIRPQPEAIPAVPAREERRALEPPAEPLPLPARRHRKSPISGVFVFVILLLLVLSAAAAYFFWRGGIPELTSLIARITGDVPPPAAAGEIRLSDLNGFFVANDEAGQLFVIQGRATNAFPEARSAIAVKGVLYNKSGKALLQQTVFSGNPLNEDALRSLPFTKIEERMNNQFGDSLSNLNVGPGKAIPFTIVFKNLPSDLAEFTVEVTDSKPGAG